MKKKVLFQDSDVRIAGSVLLRTGWDAAFEFELMSESYHETAHLAMAALAEDESFVRRGEGSVAFRAFPVIFLYRQAFELVLKAIIIAGAPAVEMDGVEMDFGIVYGTHNFEKLRPLVEQVFGTIGWGWDFGVNGFRTLADFRRVLAEFDAFDPDSTVTRYPVNTTGNPSMEAWRCINLLDFATVMDKVLEALAIVPGAIKDTIDEYYAYVSEMQ